MAGKLSVLTKPDPFRIGRPNFDPLLNPGDWREETAIRSPSRISLAAGKSHATLTGFVPFAKWKEAARWFLGYSYTRVDGDGTYHLSRFRPALHPHWAGLYASELVEAVPCDNPASWDIYAGADLPYGVYDQVRMTFAFTQRPYQILEDGADGLTSELQRYVSVKPKPMVELLTVEGGEYKFRDSAATAAAGIPANTTVPAFRFMLRVEKVNFEVTWHQVPFTWVAQPDGYMPKIFTYQGKVNSATFMSMPANTVLLESVEMEPYGDPVIADLTGDWLGKMYDIKFNFVFFDPPQGDPTNTAGDRGWQLLPSGTNGLWYPVVRQSGAVPLFRTADFNKLFTHHTDV